MKTAFIGALGLTLAILFAILTPANGTNCSLSCIENPDVPYTCISQGAKKRMPNNSTGLCYVDLCLFCRHSGNDTHAPANLTDPVALDGLYCGCERVTIPNCTPAPTPAPSPAPTPCPTSSGNTTGVVNTTIAVNATTTVAVTVTSAGTSNTTSNTDPFFLMQQHLTNTTTDSDAIRDMDQIINIIAGTLVSLVVLCMCCCLGFVYGRRRRRRNERKRGVQK